MNAPWLPSRFKLKNDLVAKNMLVSGSDWQIYNSLRNDVTILLLDETLKNKIVVQGYLPATLFETITLANVDYYYFMSDDALYPVNIGIAPENKTDALSMAVAMKRSRKINPAAPLQDAIYVAQYSILLPTFESKEVVDDEAVFGRWLTGGVNIPTSSFKHLASFCSWLSEECLVEVIEQAGLTVSDEPVKESTIPKQVSKEKFVLPGRPGLETFFNDHVIDVVQNSERYQKLGIDFPSAIILYGPPGCGKTFAAEKLVEFLGWPSYSIDANSIASPYIHQTSKLIAQTFAEAIKNAPAVVLIDEMEAFVSDRRNGGENATHHVEEVAEFLRIIPEAVKHHVLIIAMTNHLDMIDSAVRRTGRFDHVIEVGMPSKVEVASLIKALLAKRPVAANVKLDKMIELMTGRSLSDTDYVIREAARLTAKNGKELIDQSSLDEALANLPVKDNDDKRTIGF